MGDPLTSVNPVTDRFVSLIKLGFLFQRRTLNGNSDHASTVSHIRTREYPERRERIYRYIEKNASKAPGNNAQLLQRKRQAFPDEGRTNLETKTDRVARRITHQISGALQRRTGGDRTVGMITVVANRVIVVLLKWLSEWRGYAGVQAAQLPPQRLACKEFHTFPGNEVCRVCGG